MRASRGSGRAPARCSATSSRGPCCDRSAAEASAERRSTGYDSRMNDLETYFNQNTGRVIDKWEHYFEIYDRHFSRYRGTAVNMLEIGVYQGGSLQMWKEYFGPKAQIWGIDVDPKCKEFEEDQIKILIGDQENRQFLQSLVQTLPRLDILLDDGGHSMKQQIHTFEE